MASHGAKQFIASFDQNPRAAEFAHIAQHVADQCLRIAVFQQSGNAAHAVFTGERVDYFLICGKGVNVGYTRKTFDTIMESIRAGAAVQRDGARWKLRLVEGALMRYELTGSNQWISKGFATLTGTDVLARDWTVVE